VSHLRWVEYSWFQVVLLGEQDHGPWTEEDPDREMRIAVEVPIAQLLDEYEEQCARYRDLVASLDLDTPSKRPVSGRPVTLRWILFHLVEETARHNGHLDILRELADGVTGTRPVGGAKACVTRCSTTARLLGTRPNPTLTTLRCAAAGVRRHGSRERNAV
jgi:hypothetical protein